MIHSNIPLEHLSYAHYLAKYRNKTSVLDVVRQEMSNGTLVTVDGVVVASDAQLRKVLLCKVMEEYTTKARHWESFIVPAVNMDPNIRAEYLSFD